MDLTIPPPPQVETHAPPRTAEKVALEPATIAPRPIPGQRPSLLPRPARRHEKQASHIARRPAQSMPSVPPVRSIRPPKRRSVDARVCAELLALYSPLVRKIVGGFQRKLPRNVLREDLIAAGMSGLWDAIRRHPQGATESFEWYVRVRIRGAILDELRAQDWLPRRARAAAEANLGTDAYVPPPTVVRLDDVSEWDQNRCLSDSSSSELAVAAKFAQESLAKAVEQLPERERHIVSAHYFHGVKFKDLGAELGVSEPRISQLHSRAISRLKQLMNSAA